MLRMRADGSYEILGKECGGRLCLGKGAAVPTKEGSPMCLGAPGSTSEDAGSFRLEKLEDGGYRMRIVSGGRLAERLEDQCLVALSIAEPNAAGEAKAKEEQQQGFDLTFLFEPVPTSSIRLLGFPLRPGGKPEGTPLVHVEVGVDPKKGKPWAAPVTGASYHPSAGFQLLSK